MTASPAGAAASKFTAFSSVSAPILPQAGFGFNGVNVSGGNIPIKPLPGVTGVGSYAI